MRSEILIVEDNKVIQLFLRKYLESRNYRVTGISDHGDEAVELSKKLKPGLVIMDIMLPGSSIDGIEAARQIYESQKIPIIFLSALPDDVDMKRLSSSGSFGVVKKPIKDNELEAAIEMALYKYQTEEKLRQSEEKLQATITSMDDLVIVVDKSGIVREFYPSKSYSHFMKKKSQQMNRHFRDALPENIVFPLEKAISQFNSNINPVTFDFSLSDSVHTAWYGASVNIRLSPTGKFAGVTLVARDITRRVLFEKELHYRQNILKAVADASNTLITFPEIEEAIRMSLKSIGEILEIDKISIFKNFYEESKKSFVFTQLVNWMYSTESGGNGISGLQNISWLPDFKDWYERLKAGEIISAEIDLLKQKEKDILEGIHVKSFIMVPILINYFFWGFIGFDDSNKARSWTDFDKHVLKTMAGTIGGAIDRFDKEQSLLDTEDELSKNIRQLEISQKELEQATSLLIQNEKLATLGTIASSVAHEINSPLGAILNCAERLNEGDLDEKRSSQNIKLILNAATRCKYVVDKLLVTSRQNPDKEECQIAGVVDDWFELYGKQLELQDIEYKTEIHQNMVVMINYNECSQILTNVILNARDALSETDIGQRTIVLKAYPLEDNAIIEIFNNGPLIPDEYKDKIFEVFFTSKESGKGTGLGLWICKNILDKVNGSISIQNVPDGVVNKIVIPLKKK